MTVTGGVRRSAGRGRPPTETASASRFAAPDTHACALRHNREEGAVSGNRHSAYERNRPL
jgi:hypothetical protein